MSIEYPIITNLIVNKIVPCKKLQRLKWKMVNLFQGNILIIKQNKKLTIVSITQRNYFNSRIRFFSFRDSIPAFICSPQRVFLSTSTMSSLYLDFPMSKLIKIFVQLQDAPFQIQKYHCTSSIIKGTPSQPTPKLLSQSVFHYSQLLCVHSVFILLS